ncbi:hypothetical protein [Frigoriflavimonas asaccharolytica]|uniref:Calx-beta domain-containing protein n=1 Tax=Frigoriflavimonas asaccharolytica TaxID=2735899 RepID=A0A8J8G7L2_9FLAO|nr:hypothetical protein [Frigoriflavimonas asaccharolytica]NRS92784.1 hypothetical protein [Frigoriflavimonas asaccharolytica]
MKKVYFLSNKLKFSFLALIMLSTFAILSSCKDEETDPFEDVTIQFKVESTAGVVLKAVVTQIGVDQAQEFTFTSNAYNSVPRIVSTSVGALHLAVTATGVDADSKVTAKIIVNGQEKAIDLAQGGGSLTAKAQYNFIK